MQVETRDVADSFDFFLGSAEVGGLLEFFGVGQLLADIRDLRLADLIVSNGLEEIVDAALT